jgi:hypothetical protein
MVSNELAGILEEHVRQLTPSMNGQGVMADVMFLIG